MTRMSIRGVRLSTVIRHCSAPFPTSLFCLFTFVETVGEWHPARSSHSPRLSMLREVLAGINIPSC